jgi:hypothetical protein
LNTNLIMDVVTHVVREFDISLDELHNDSTTVIRRPSRSAASIQKPSRKRSAPAK